MSKMCLEKFEKTFGGGRMNPRKFEKNLSHDSGVGVLRACLLEAAATLSRDLKACGAACGFPKFPMGSVVRQARLKRAGGAAARSTKTGGKAAESQLNSLIFNELSTIENAFDAL